MRRAEETAARPPPFRVLAVPDGNYLSPGIPPPPPRAPEPYKVAPSSMSSSRAHRRSSFVIIADSRPATPESRSPSPGLNTGRVSPFRGRGFKGPPPRSKSRPQSPEVDPRKRPRTDRRVSVSQQNSPRRSLIPQPTTRRRSISLTKPNERPSSPKIGRRVDSRSRLNLSDSRNRLNASSNSNSVTNLSTRRQPTKPSTRLSPIQGTPTKPEKNASQVAKRDRSRETERPSPAKTPRFVGSPSKNAPNVKRFNQENAANPGKERLASPSKIPLKANRDGMASLNPARFITVPDQPNGKSGPKKNEKSTKDATKVERFAKAPGQSVKQSEGGSKETDSSGKSSGAQKVDAVDLIDLLKQNSSGATGTSSVVSTTTTTAAQPLHIDAHANRTEKESEKRNPAERRSGPERTKDQPETTNDKSAGSVTSNEDSRRSVPNGQEDIVQRSTNNPVSAKTGKGNNYNRGRPLADSRNESPVPTEAAANTSKGNNGPQSAKAGRVNGASSGGGSATQRPNRTHQGAGAFNEQNNRNVRPTHQRTERIEEVSPGQPASTNERSQSGAVVANQASKPGDTEAPGDFNKSITSNYVSNVERAAPSGSASTKVVEPKVPSRSTEPAGRNGPATTTANATGQVTSARTSLVNSSAVNGSQNTNENQVGVNNPGNVTEPRGVTSGRARNGNRGSDASLKSSGVSTDSNESVRSTDTGVSVNTVKGVSSPREKTGMHVVKRPQEIETLSGNVMHHEQNVEGKETLVDQFLIGGKSQNFPIVEYVYCVSGTGAPSLLDGGCYSSLEGRLLAATNGAEAEQPSSDRFLAHWKKSVADYCGCCRSMRCLACRTDSKKISWPKKQARTAVAAAGSEAAPQLPADAAAPEPTQTGWWARVKGGCRCDRLKAIKCCSRGSRIAPAEATACCPPERRFGAICHRLFERCKCRRAEAERKRSIRAKHSLTSVAPPPLSEEPKAKIPDVLVEHNSLMRGAIPCLPVPLAWFCLVWNVLLPGSGTVWSGLFNLCTGQPRFSPVAGLKSRLGALVVNLVVGVGQLFTVLFCLVGWGWSIWWGVTLVRLARKYKRYKASEAANNDPEARGEPAALPPGVPSQALREMERAR